MPAPDQTIKDIEDALYKFSNLISQDLTTLANRYPQDQIIQQYIKNVIMHVDNLLEIVSTALHDPGKKDLSQN